MILEIKKINVQKIWNILIIFLFVFEISVKGIPTLFSTRKVIFIFLVFEFILQKNKNYISMQDRNSLIYTFFSLSGICFYVICVSLLRDNLLDSHCILSRIIYLIVYFIGGCFIFTTRYRRLRDYMDDVIWCMLIQSIVVFFEFHSHRFKNFLNLFINQGGVNFFREERGTGIGAEASYLTLLLFVGVFCCNYIIIVYGYERKYLFMQAVLLMGMFFVGRTGIYASILFIVIVYAYYAIRKKGLLFVLKYVVFAGGFVSVLFVLFRNFLSRSQYRRLVRRFLSGLLGFSNDASVGAFRNMAIPPISMDTIIGMGVYKGRLTNGELIWHDGGYVQSFLALGLIVSILYYVVILTAWLKIMPTKDSRFFFNIYLILLLICEVKEPYIIKAMLILFLFTFCLIEKREDRECSGGEVVHKENKAVLYNDMRKEPVIIDNNWNIKNENSVLLCSEVAIQRSK